MELGEKISVISHTSLGAIITHKHVRATASFLAI